MERMQTVENSLNHDQVENFHELIFTNNLFAAKDYPYQNLKDIIRDKDLVLLNGNKDPSVVIMNRIDYNTMTLKMIDNGIKYKIHEETADNTLKYLKTFLEFLYRNISDYQN